MANGIAIKDVTNKLQELNGEEVVPISSGADEPEVVEVDTLKEYVNEDVETALEGKRDIINDLATIRSGAALGATAMQDSDISDWAKAEQKPSYSYSEITEKPTFSTVATSGSYNDLTNTPTIPDVPEWAMSSTKPSYSVNEIDGAQEELESGVNIKTVNNQSLLGSGNITIQGGGGGDVNVIESITFNGSAVPVDGNKNAAITYTETDPTVPSWAKAASKPSYTASEVGALPDTTSIPTESTVSGWGFTKNTGTVTSVTVNGSSHNPTNGVVDLGTVITDVSDKENTSNKVTSLSFSSTDTQYPSAKCVWDLVGDIETILASI